MRAVFLEPQSRKPRKPRAATVDPSPTPRASLFALLGRSFRSVARHAGLYALVGIAVIGAEALIVFNLHKNTAISVSIAGLIVEPFFVAIVTAFSYADARGDLSVRATWLRVLDRSWAVLIIGFLVNLTFIIGYEAISAPDIFDKLLGSAVLILTVSLVFADVHATVVDDAEPWWLLVPRSIAVSMVVAWQGITFARALIVFMVNLLLPELIASIVQSLFQLRHLPNGLFWGNALSVVLLLPLVQAFCTFVYLDAIGYEPERS